ncbi:MAG TPA: nickel pincer cofactor biosynthesis protein LarC, partial [Sedimentisphaerales bacterium]|nr:nickel pincer cofactor biosynthesis protein LarC [Sedimentisphaerales bacterium]
MKMAYFDCFAGAAGDMIAAALLDAGLDPQFLRCQLATLGIEGLKVDIAETHRCGQRALTFRPSAPEQHHHRHLSDIVAIIDGSGISPTAKKTAIGVFDTLARAEATVHGTTPDRVHFHEVGAVDSIVDVVTAAIGLDALEIQRVFASTLSVGGGSIRAAHGTMPAPAPATVEILREKGAPVRSGPAEMELLTPTAAAILATVVEAFTPLPPMSISAIGCGAGTFNSKAFPNVLRVFVGEEAACNDENADTVCVLESNIDDATGEAIGAAMEELLRTGALDVYTIPIGMKGSRPATMLCVLCRPGDADILQRMLFASGLTLGVRRQMMERSKLQRSFTCVQTEYGPI